MNTYSPAHHRSLVHPRPDTPLRQPSLLVSVRNEEEAQAALAGGADIIDIKEPSRGPLGMADLDTMQRVIKAIRDRTIVTAALGELRDAHPARSAIPSGLALVKVGLAGESAHDDWTTRLTHLRHQLNIPLIAVAYADYQLIVAPAPAPDEVLRWAICAKAPALLIDTAMKGPANLLDHLHIDKLRDLITHAHANGINVALAGSLDKRSLTLAASLGADVLAVRGAACQRGDRESPISLDRVRALRQLIERATTAQSAAAD